MLQQLFTDTQTKRIFHRLNTSYNNGVPAKIMQHNSGGTVQYWQRIQFQILVNLLKWYIQRFLVKMVVEVLITLTQKINDCRQQTMMKILAIRMANHPLYPTLSPILSLLLLLLQPSANPYQYTASKALSTKKVKKENPHRCSNADHSGIIQQSYRYTNRLGGQMDY